MASGAWPPYAPHRELPAPGNVWGPREHEGNKTLVILQQMRSMQFLDSGQTLEYFMARLQPEFGLFTLSGKLNTFAVGGIISETER